MIKRAKGFTLIELLAVIVILMVILLISFLSYSFYFKSTQKELKKIEINNLINAGMAYQKEFENSNEYNSFTENIAGNEFTYSCISVQSLINKGFYKNNLQFYNKDLTPDKTVIKITKKNGVSSYELLYNYIEEEDCSYYDYEKVLDSDTVVTVEDINNSDNNGISLETNILNNSNSKNKYTLKLKFTADMKTEIVNHIMPVYALIVLDSSGSMRNNQKYSLARSSAINLSKEIIKLKDAHVALVNFANTSYIRRDFSSKELVPDNFREVDGGTNILSALDTAYSMISKVEKNSIKYVIFLTDGKPEPPKCSSKYYASEAQCLEYRKCNSNINKTCQDALIQYSNKIKDTDSNLVVIGYDINNDVYKTMSTIDETGTICPTSEFKDSSGNNYCYYYSNSSSISNLFSSISDSISETVKSQQVNEGIVNAKFDKSVTIYDISGNEIKDLVIDIKLDDDNIGDIFEKEYEYIMNIEDIDENNLNCDYEKKTCTYKANLFEKYYVNLYDKNNNYLTQLVMKNSPVITISRNLKLYLN